MKDTQLPELAVDVVWGDVTKVDGDVYAVGHYEQVLPQNAELALDRAISGEGRDRDAFVLTSLTRRGILRGALGNVELFPWGDGNRTVAVCGMGHPGGFGPLDLRRLARNLAWAVSVLPRADTLCSVLIGAGAGNLSIADSASGLLLGVVDAIGPGLPERRLKRLRIVEQELGRARAIHRQIATLCASPSLGGRVRVTLADFDDDPKQGGVVGDAYCMALTLGAAALSHDDKGERRAALEQLLGAVPHPPGFAAAALAAFERLAASDRAADARAADVADIAEALTVEFGPPPPSATIPTRISMVCDDASIRAAALTDTTVVPERALPYDRGLVDDLVAQMTGPPSGKVRDLSALLARLVIPPDFRGAVERARSLVFEVDRSMARIHWEMLSDSPTSDDAEPIALKVDVARQLRTTYSPPPSAERAPQGPLRALVIGDPGDPDEGASLPAARAEALAVADLLESRGVEVTRMIGAPSVLREGPLQGVRFAKRLDVLQELMKGGYDLLHYSGHGDFDAEHPERSGWVFQGGLLTSSQLELVDMAPSLVFANACLTSLTAADVESGVSDAKGRSSKLLPGLADEFFRRGVRNYVGTAWPVNDDGAVLFAKEFYAALLGDPRATIGESLRQARTRLKQDEKIYRTLWAAYQHYGDPQFRLALGGEPAPA